MKSSDPNTYFSCDDHFPVVEVDNRIDQGENHFREHLFDMNGTATFSHEALSSEGTYMCTVVIIYMLSEQKRTGKKVISHELCWFGSPP